jgi:predicted metal-dependent hydrolase
VIRSFPSYRHRPGHTAHPRTNPQGHSHGEPEPVSPALTRDNWPHHEAWLFGVELFNGRYWWEAHEQWEAPWRVSDAELTRHLLQGLIQTAAALLKWDLGNERGRSGLWGRAEGHLESVVSQQNPYLGLDVSSFIAQMQDLWQSRSAAVPPLQLTRPIS